MDIVTNAALLALLTAPLVVLAMWTSKRRWWMPAALFLGLLAFDDLLTALPRAVEALDVVPGRWNWEGKALSLGWALAFIAFGPLSTLEAGLTLRQRAGSIRPALLGTLALTAVSFGIGLLFGGGGPDAETVAFQFTAPGLAEEVVYRGVFIGLLHQALVTPDGARRWWPVLITAVAFGLWHGLGVRDGAVSFDALSASFPLIGGFAYGWLRERTGSVVIPVVAHNLGNTAAVIGQRSQDSRPPVRKDPRLQAGDEPDRVAAAGDSDWVHAATVG